MSNMTEKNKEDINMLILLEKAYSQLIKQGISEFNWDNDAAVQEAKQKMMNKIQTVTIKAFKKIGVNTNSINRSDTEQQDYFKDNNNNKTSSSNGQKSAREDYYPSNKDNNRNDRSFNDNNRNKLTSKNNTLNKTFSHNSQDDNDERFGESDSEHRNNHQSDYESKNGFYLDRPRRGGLGLPCLSQSASINSYPMDEKKRVLDYFNQNYDPVKRNKIELVEQMVKEFGYSKSSLYYLVTNQKMYEAVQKQIEMQARGMTYPPSHSYTSDGILIYSPNTPIGSYHQPKFQKDNRGDNRDIREYTREYRDNNNRDSRDYREDRQRNSRNQNDRERSRSSPDNKNSKRELRSSNQEVNGKNNYNQSDSKKDESAQFQQQQKGNTSQNDRSSGNRQQQQTTNNNLLTDKVEEEKLNINKNSRDQSNTDSTQQH